MREKTRKNLITFRSTTGALEMEAYCMDQGLPGRLIPVPVTISAGCGMAWCVPAEKWSLLTKALEKFAGQVENTYEIWL